MEWALYRKNMQKRKLWMISVLSFICTWAIGVFFFLGFLKIGGEKVQFVQTLIDMFKDIKGTLFMVLFSFVLAIFTGDVAALFAITLLEPIMALITIGVGIGLIFSLLFITIRFIRGCTGSSTWYLTMERTTKSFRKVFLTLIEYIIIAYLWISVATYDLELSTPAILLIVVGGLYLILKNILNNVGSEDWKGLAHFFVYIGYDIIKIAVVTVGLYFFLQEDLLLKMFCFSSETFLYILKGSLYANMAQEAGATDVVMKASFEAYLHNVLLHYLKYIFAYIALRCFIKSIEWHLTDSHELAGRDSTRNAMIWMIVAVVADILTITAFRGVFKMDVEGWLNGTGGYFAYAMLCMIICFVVIHFARKATFMAKLYQVEKIITRGEARREKEAAALKENMENLKAAKEEAEVETAVSEPEKKEEDQPLA